MSTETTSPVLRPTRPYQPVTLYWDFQCGINGNGQGGIATRKQLQEALASVGREASSTGGTLMSLVPGAVVQLADGLYWLSQDWQVLCL